MEKVRIGLVGVAHRAHIAKSWQEDKRSEVVAGCDIYPEYLEEFQKTYGRDTFITEDYKELVKRDDIDAVAIFTPDDFHYQPAIAAMEAGKDVFLEKPMAITIEDCLAIRKVEKETGRKLMIGFNLRYNDYFSTIKDIIDSGAIGDIRAAWVRHFVGYGGYAYFHDYRGNRKGSTSLLLQKASHDIDAIHYLTGEYTQRVIGMGALMEYGGDKPDDLTCDKCDEDDSCMEYSARDDGPNKRMCLFRKEVDVEDHSMIMMQLTGGVQANYSQCHFSPDSWRNYTIIGNKGRIESNNDETVTLYTRKKNPKKNERKINYAEALYKIGAAKGGHGGGDPKICRAFLDFLIDDVPPRASSFDGLISVAVGVKGAESLRNGNMPVDIEFKKD